VGYFHGYIDGVDFVFVDHPAFHYVADAIYGGDRQAITWRCALLCKVRGGARLATCAALRCGDACNVHSECRLPGCEQIVMKCQELPLHSMPLMSAVITSFQAACS